MKTVNHKDFLLSLSFFFFINQVLPQSHCKDIDLNKQPGKWVWQKSNGVSLPAPAGSWLTCEPIRKELQRIMPQPVEGIVSTNYISPTGANTIFNTTNFPSSYTNTVMIKDYECIMYPNAKVQPEGETGCWIYFTVNYWNSTTVLPGSNEITYTEYPSNLYLTELWYETDANGNQAMYSSTNKETAFFQSYFFTPKKRFPFRKLTRNELFNCYKVFHEKRLNDKVAEYEKNVAKEQADYNNLSAAEKKAQSYRLDVMDKTKNILNSYKEEKDKMANWYSAVMKQTNINDTAYAEEIAAWRFEPEKLDAKPGKGKPVWIDDINFYDRSKPADQPQCIFLYYRRQDKDLPKKNFLDKFCNEFNLDVLAKMVGDNIKKPGEINSLSGSLNDAKQETKLNQGSVNNYSYSFDNEKTGAFPSGWEGMKNISVNSLNGKNRLAMTKDGYWYPKQYNKEIKNGFDLSFDVTWSKDISYYSGYFTVTFSELPFDNAGQRYAINENQYQYWSFYKSYAGNFNRVILMFDPYWNNGGALYIYSYDASEKILLEKRITLPDFYKEKNNHQLRIQRKGNGLLVSDNGKIIADLANVFNSNIRYNLYTFSRYKGDNNDTGNDAFYLDNINTSY